MRQALGRKRQIDDERLLAVARETFRRHGGFATTRQIAEAAGISEAAVFKRYPTKAALYLAAMLPPEVAPNALIADEIEDTREALVETATRLLVYFRELLPAALQLAVHPSASLADIAAHFSPERTARVADALRAFLDERAARGDVAPPDAMAATQLLISAVHSLAVYETIGLHGGGDMSPAIAPFIDQLWHGIGPRAQSPQPKRKD